MNGITFNVATADAETSSAGDTHQTTISTSSPVAISDMEAVLDKIAYNNTSPAPDDSLTKVFDVSVKDNTTQKPQLQLLRSLLLLLYQQMTSQLLI